MNRTKRRSSGLIAAIILLPGLASFIGLAGWALPAHSRLLLGLSFFLLSIQSIGVSLFAIWAFWIKPIDRNLLKQRNRELRAVFGRLSWLWPMPDAYFFASLRAIPLFGIPIGLFTLLMVIDHYILGHQILQIWINLP